MNIENGALVRSSSAVIGRNFGGVGIATVSGADSTWRITSSISGFGIGFNGNGTLVVANGGTVEKNSGSTNIGWFANSESSVFVSGKNSLLSVDELRVGLFGTGTLDVSNGGRVEGTQVSVGDAFKSTGTINLSGTNTELVSNSVSLGVSPAGSGVVNIFDGANLVVGNAVQVGAAGTLNLWDGGLHFSTSSGRLFNSGVVNFAGGTIRNAATIESTAPFRQAGGSLEPGNFVGSTEILGGYEFDFGILEIDLNGTGTAGVNYDQLNVVGEVDLIGDDLLANSELKIRLGYAAELGDVFTILTNDDLDPVLGTFASGNLLSAIHEDIEYTFLVDYASGTGNDITLTVVPEPANCVLLVIANLFFLRRKR